MCIRDRMGEVLPEPGMSCSVCHLHLMLSYVEMYERNKMMMMMMMASPKPLTDELGY